MLGKIYKLTDGIKFYYGSTIRSLNERLYTHKAEAKKRPTPCHHYFNSIGWHKVQIELVEECDVADKKALFLREGQIIKEHINNENCLNCCIAGAVISVDGMKNYQTQYYAANKEAINTKQRDYQREYHVANKEALNAKRKEYYAANKKAINAKQRERRAAKKNTTLTRV